MDGNRRYPDEPEPSWYTGQSPTPRPPGNAYDSGVHERPSGAFRLPAPGESGYIPAPYATPDPVSNTGSHSFPVTDPSATTQSRMSVRGPEYPAVRPTTGGTSLADAPPPGTYATGQRAVTPRTGERVFRTRRPVFGILIAAVTAVLEIPAIMLLIEATFGDGPMLPGSLVPGVLLTLGLPLTGGGLYALITTAPYAPWVSDRSLPQDSKLFRRSNLAARQPGESVLVDLGLSRK